MTAPTPPLLVRQEDVALIKGALHALRSYQYGNADPTLAGNAANALEAALSRAQPAGQGEALEQAYIALEFYANRRSYEAQPSEDSASGFEDPAVFTDDYGALARETLRAIDAALNAQSQGGPRG